MKVSAFIPKLLWSLAILTFPCVSQTHVVVVGPTYEADGYAKQGQKIKWVAASKGVDFWVVPEAGLCKTGVTPLHVQYGSPQTCTVPKQKLKGKVWNTYSYEIRSTYEPSSNKNKDAPPSVILFDHVGSGGPGPFAPPPGTSGAPTPPVNPSATPGTTPASSHTTPVITPPRIKLFCEGNQAKMKDYGIPNYTKEDLQWFVDDANVIWSLTFDGGSSPCDKTSYDSNNPVCHLTTPGPFSYTVVLKDTAGTEKCRGTIPLKVEQSTN